MEWQKALFLRWASHDEVSVALHTNESIFTRSSTFKGEAKIPSLVVFRHHFISPFPNFPRLTSFMPQGEGER